MHVLVHSQGPKSVTWFGSPVAIAYSEDNITKVHYLGFSHRRL